MYVLERGKIRFRGGAASRRSREGRLPLRVSGGGAYDGEGGLKEKMLAIKEAVKSQNGSQSPEFLQVKGIRV